MSPVIGMLLRNSMTSVNGHSLTNCLRCDDSIENSLQCEDSISRSDKDKSVVNFSNKI